MDFVAKGTAKKVKSFNIAPILDHSTFVVRSVWDSELTMEMIISKLNASKSIIIAIQREPDEEEERKNHSQHAYSLRSVKEEEGSVPPPLA